MSDQIQIGRLAMRQEGGNWVAYYAVKETMKDAVFIGSIRMAAIMRNRERKSAFMDMMRDIVADIIEESAGGRCGKKGKIVINGIFIQVSLNYSGRKKGIDLRGEINFSIRQGVIQGFLAEPVAN